MNYNKAMFMRYVLEVISEMEERNIKFQARYYEEINDFCGDLSSPHYPEHNDRYLKECLYNLEEKAIRGIITKDEWMKIYDEFKDFTELWNSEKEVK